MSSVCLRVCMYISLAPEQLDPFYLCSVFKSLSIIGLFSMNMNILAQKNVGPS
jgi:hypothetical protein